jgi:hypothetical protein
MKKKKSLKKLSLTLQTINNLSMIKGAGPLVQNEATGCVCGTGDSCGIVCY